MAHERSRHIMEIIRVRSKLWPIIGIIGPRQCGKSTLLRNQIKNGTYITMDSPSARRSAEISPELFIRDSLTLASKLTIDEIQKVPDLFDTLKLLVDEKRRPGTFVISGSTQFSSKVGIRESLTGRIGIQHLFPLTSAEAHALPFRKPLVNLAYNKPVSSSEISMVNVLKMARSGGMPGHCFLRSKKEREEYLRGWVETTCYRDTLQVEAKQHDPALLIKIYNYVAKNPFHDLTKIARSLSVSTQRVSKQVSILEEIFAIMRIESAEFVAGKPRFFVPDSGFTMTAGASELDAVRVWLYNELRAQFEYSGEKPVRVEFYQSKNGSLIDYILPEFQMAFLVTDEEIVHEYKLRAAKAFAKKHKGWRVIIASPSTVRIRINADVAVIPWNNLC